MCPYHVQQLILHLQEVVLQTWTEIFLWAFPNIWLQSKFQVKWKYISTLFINLCKAPCHIKLVWENIQGNPMYEQICLNCKFLCFRKWCCNRARQNTDWYTKVCTDWAGKGILDWDEGSKLLLSEINHSNHKWSCFTRINGRSCCLLFLSACQVVNLSNSDSYKVGGNTPCCIFLQLKIESSHYSSGYSWQKVVFENILWGCCDWGTACFTLNTRLAQLPPSNCTLEPES